MVGVSVRDEDQVDGEVGRIGGRSVPLEWSQPLAKEWIGQDPVAVDLEQDGGVSDEPDEEGRRRHAAVTAPGRTSAYG